MSGRREIERFLQQHPIMKSANLSDKIARIKNKVFNERKRVRELLLRRAETLLYIPEWLSIRKEILTCRWPWGPPPSQRRARVSEGMAVWRAEMSAYIFSSEIALPLAVLPLAGSGKIPIGHRPGWLIPPLKGPARPEIEE